jgi:hypothetical protein
MVVFRGETVVENAVFLLDVAGRSWIKLSSSGPWPQNLYELTALAYDSKRERLVLHGGGKDRDELWEFEIDKGVWRKLNPAGSAPVCQREAVYIPGEDVFFTLGYPVDKPEKLGVYVYGMDENKWYRVEIEPPPGKDSRVLVSQNRAITYDPIHKVILMVLGERSGGDAGQAQVYALRLNVDRSGSLESGGPLGR